MSAGCSNITETLFQFLIFSVQAVKKTRPTSKYLSACLLSIHQCRVCVFIYALEHNDNKKSSVIFPQSVGTPQVLRVIFCTITLKYTHMVMIHTLKFHTVYDVKSSSL